MLRPASGCSSVTRTSRRCSSCGAYSREWRFSMARSSVDPDRTDDSRNTGLLSKRCMTASERSFQLVEHPEAVLDHRGQPAAPRQRGRQPAGQAEQGRQGGPVAGPGP